MTRGPQSLTQAQLRTEVLKKVSLLSPEERSELSQRACSRFKDTFLSLHNLNGGQLRKKNIALYQSLPRELEVADLQTIVDDEGNLYLPRLAHPQATEIEMAKFGPLECGPFGIQQPSGEALQIDPVDLDLILVPGVAFGRGGERIGMGIGFYDRYLTRAKNALRVSLCFSFQVYDGFFQNPWDQKIDLLITDEEEIRLPGFSKWAGL